MGSAIKTGERLGLDIIPIIKYAEPEEHSDKVKFWGGLFASLAGAAAGSIGSEVSGALLQLMDDLAKEMLNEKSH